MRIGFLGRAAAVFRVDEICVYPDLYGFKDQKEEATFIKDVLRYMEAPPHLKRKLISLRSRLRYAGLLPPLRTPSHTPRRTVEEAILGEVREGIVEKTGRKYCYVDVGFDKPLKLIGASYPRGRRVTVRIIEGENGLYCKPIRHDKLKFYWTFRVYTTFKPLSEVLKNYRKKGIAIATSKYGIPITALLEELKSRLNSCRSLALVFGSPREGLKQIAGRQGFRIEDHVDYIVNTIPEQGSYTVRTEEAVYATLAIFNLISAL